MNSHRLLVRGERREYEEEELMEQTVEREAKKSRTAGLLAAGCAVSAAALSFTIHRYEINSQPQKHASVNRFVHCEGYYCFKQSVTKRCRSFILTCRRTSFPHRMFL